VASSGEHHREQELQPQRKGPPQNKVRGVVWRCGCGRGRDAGFLALLTLVWVRRAGFSGRQSATRFRGSGRQSGRQLRFRGPRKPERQARRPAVARVFDGEGFTKTAVACPGAGLRRGPLRLAHGSSRSCTRFCGGGGSRTASLQGSSATEQLGHEAAGTHRATRSSRATSRVRPGVLGSTQVFRMKIRITSMSAWPTPTPPH